MIHSGFSVTTGELPGGDRPSEDRIFRVPAAVVVLDGVSTLTDARPRGGWYAQTLGEHLAAGLAAEPETDLRQVLAQAISTVAREHRLIPGSSPAATVAIVRHRGEHTDALVLADSPVVALTTDGNADPLRDDRLERLVSSQPEYAEYRSRLRAGHGFRAPQHRALLQELRAHQLRHLNNGAPGGYWVAEAVPEAAHHAVTRSWASSGISEILMMTDGASAGVEEYGLYPGWAALARACRTEGPGTVLRAIRDAEAADPHGQRWPRYKLSDDKALAHLRFTGNRLAGRT